MCLSLLIFLKNADSECGGRRKRSKSCIAVGIYLPFAINQTSFYQPAEPIDKRRARSRYRFLPHLQVATRIYHSSLLDNDVNPILFAETSNARARIPSERTKLGQMIRLALLVVATLFLPIGSAYIVPSVINMDPVIGILTVPLDSIQEPCITINQLDSMRDLPTSPSEASCFTAFYNKWLEASGARVVVIPYNANTSTIDSILSSVNGVLFTGGGLNLWFNTTYVQTANYIFNQVQKFNDQGIFYPLHGTCMGMQLLSILSAHNESVLSTNAFDSENMSLPLDFTPNGVQNSRIFSVAPTNILQTYQTQNCTENLHHDGVSPAIFADNKNLTEFWYLISTNADRKGALFVSTLAAKNYPITATQWHVERPQFEHKPGLGLDHWIDAIAAMQYYGNFFVNDARRNNLTFADTTLFNALSTYGMNLLNEETLSWGYQSYAVSYP
jgi:gamma-glutamyl hydrolase